MRIAESTWRFTEGSYFAFCSSVLSPEGKDQVGGKREQLTHHREVPRNSTMSPNEPEHDDAEGWCKTVEVWKVSEKCKLASQRSNRRIAKEVGDPDLDRRWTKDNFKGKSVKLGVPKKLLANRRTGRRL
uniref:Uncharacterized protein n=1 Tax=Solanum tuberosum TaxID=4113 RepID=M1DL42_SOLTU